MQTGLLQGTMSPCSMLPSYSGSAATQGACHKGLDHHNRLSSSGTFLPRTATRQELQVRRRASVEWSGVRGRQTACSQRLPGDTPAVHYVSCRTGSAGDFLLLAMDFQLGPGSMNETIVTPRLRRRAHKQVREPCPTRWHFLVANALHGTGTSTQSEAVQNGSTNEATTPETSSSYKALERLGSSNSSSGLAESAEAPISPAVMAEVTTRLQRLQILVLLRRLYRDVIRSERILGLPIPKLAVEGEEDEYAGPEPKAEKRKKSRRRIRNWIGNDWWQRGRTEEEQELVVSSPGEILEYVADIQELATGLRSSLAAFDGQLGVVFQGDPLAEKVIGKTVVEISEGLEELARKVERVLTPEQRDAALVEQQKGELSEGDDETNVQTRVLRRLEKSLPNTGLVLDSVRRRIATVDLSRLDLNFIQRRGYDVLQTVVNVWRRLNGRPDPSRTEPLTAGLPRPVSVLSTEEERKLGLILEVEALDKKLGEVSRNREQRLRQKNALARTRLALEIRAMDDEVNEVRKELAVRTLQVEMSIICMSLESELLDIAGSQDVRTDEEESLLVAEFGLLDFDLARLRTAVDRSEAILVDDEELEVLATDIPDLKSRLGIIEEASIPLGQRASLQVTESVQKLRAGASFYWRGMRLLGGDINYSFRLFWAAVTGTTLKPREVQAVRRTAKDVLVLIPFSIILIAPITPIGHVLVFSFLQRYFPGFFPSSFSPKRQEVMKKYELIKTQLQLAPSEREKEEALAMAAAAAAETFETSEEDAAGSHGLSNKTKSPAVEPRAPRRLTERPVNLLLLQEQLPELARILSNIKVEESQGEKPAKERQVTKVLTDRSEAGVSGAKLVAASVLQTEEGEKGRQSA